METEKLPWLFAVLTAGWFGWMANRAGRSWALWGVGGAIFGLVISTVMIGLGQALSIPYSDHQSAMDSLKWMVVAVLLILAVGWLLTAGLHRHHIRTQQARATQALASQGAEPRPSAGASAPKKATGGGAV